MCRRALERVARGVCHGRYTCVREVSEAESLWRDAYEVEEAARVKEIKLLCGCILPIWTSLSAALRCQLMTGEPTRG